MSRKALVLLLVATVGFFMVSCGKKDVSKVSSDSQTVMVEEAYDEDILKGTSTQAKDGTFSGLAVYLDQGYFKNHYSPSGWMGDYGDLKINEGCKDNPHSRRTCIKITYEASATQGASWAGVYWQNPPNNWGEKKGGFDLTGAKRLVFWARGEKGGEVIAEFKVGGITGTYSDTDSDSIGPVTLSQEWQEYSVDLKGMDLSYISGGFCFIIKRTDNPDGCVFYLDDIKYE